MVPLLKYPFLGKDRLFTYNHCTIIIIIIGIEDVNVKIKIIIVAIHRPYSCETIVTLENDNLTQIDIYR